MSGHQASPAHPSSNMASQISPESVPYPTVGAVAAHTSITQSGPSTSSNSAFVVALLKYQSSLTPAEANSFQPSSAQDVINQVKDIQAKRRRASRTQALLERLDPFINTLQQYSKSIDVLVSSHPMPTALLWGGIRFLLQIASSYATFLEKMVSIFDLIEANLPRYQLYEGIFSSAPRIQEAVVAVYGDILQICKDVRECFESKAFRTLQTILWQSFQVKFDATLERFRQHRKLIENEVFAQNVQEAEKERQLAREERRKDQLERERANSHRELTALEHQRMKATLQRSLTVVDEHHVEVIREKHLAWLNPPDNYDLYRRKKDLRHPGTFDWVLHESMFTSHLTSEQNSILWIHGIPGCGKSVLAAMIIDWLQSNPTVPSANQQNNVIYFFCDANHPNYRTGNKLWSSLVAQLACCYAEHTYSAALNDAYKQRASPVGTGSYLWEVMTKMVTELQSQVMLHIVIDGLDENERDGLPEFLQHLSGIIKCQPKKKLKVLVLSRDIQEIRGCLGDSPTISLTAPKLKQKIASDIQLYIRYRLDKIPFLSNPRRRSIRKLLLDSMIKGAHGMFQWVELIFYRLERTVTYDHNYLLTLAQTLPIGLEAAYTRELRVISQEPEPLRRDLGLRVLEWTMYAKRPLTLRELEIALSVNEDDKELREPTFVDLRKTILELCGSLVEFHSNVPSLPEYDTLHFVHATVRDVLLSMADARTSSSRPENSSSSTCLLPISPSHLANERILINCITYITLACREYARLHPERPQSPPDPNIKYGFLEYCSLYLFHHLLDTEGSACFSNITRFAETMRRLKPERFVWMAAIRAARGAYTVSTVTRTAPKVLDWFRNHVDGLKMSSSPDLSLVHWVGSLFEKDLIPMDFHRMGRVTAEPEVFSHFSRPISTAIITDSMPTSHEPIVATGSNTEKTTNSQRYVRQIPRKTCWGKAPRKSCGGKAPPKYILGKLRKG